MNYTKESNITTKELQFLHKYVEENCPTKANNRMAGMLLLRQCDWSLEAIGKTYFPPITTERVRQQEAKAIEMIKCLIR